MSHDHVVRSVDAETFRRCKKSAREHANRVAPLPKTDADSAGLAGALIAGIYVAIFIAFAGLQDSNLAAAYFVTLCVGFLGPYVFLYIQKLRHYRLLHTEFKRLVDVERARRAGGVRLGDVHNQLSGRLPEALEAATALQANYGSL
jgi:hypothetical protein